MRSNNLHAIARQSEMPIAARHGEGQPFDISLVIKQQTFLSAIKLCIQVSGMDEKEVYIPLQIDAGHWSRIMKGEAHFPVNKLTDLMDLCENEIPLIWLSNKRGYELRPLETELEIQLRKEREKLAESERENSLLRSLLSGKSS